MVAPTKLFSKFHCPKSKQSSHNAKKQTTIIYIHIEERL